MIQKKKKKRNKIVLVAKTNLNSVENIMSKALKVDKNSHENYATIINEEGNYRELKESIRIMKSQRSNIEPDKLIKDGILIGIDKIIKQKK